MRIACCLVLLSLLVVSAAAADTPQVDPQILDVLHKVESKINSWSYLSYHVERKQEMQDNERGNSQSSATVWLQKKPADKLFGAVFHVHGTASYGTYDYFYDGEISWESMDQYRKVRLVRRTDYDEDMYHPAKARVAALMLREWLYAPDFASSVLENSKSAAMTESDDHARWLIRIPYHTDELGSDKTITYEIDKSTDRIVRVVMESNWRGTEIYGEWTFSDFKQGKKAVAGHIAKPEGFKSEYEVQDYKNRPKSNKPSARDLIGQAAPDFSATSFSGEEISLKQFRGKLVLLDFWEFWCGACKIAMPSTNKLQQKWKGKLVVIGVVTENEKEVRKIIEHEKLSYINVMADKDLHKTYRVRGWPSYYLIDRDGQILDAGAGNEDRVKAKIEQLLSEHDTDTPQPATEHVK